jgi:chitin disaccharide deacetylase
MKRCIVSADDFAYNAAVDDGILALIDAGVVTATSCLTRSPRWRAAARQLGATAGARADVGLHVDLTEFEHLTMSHAALVGACCARAIDASQVHSILITQFERFEDALGRAPDYVDGHRHVHQLPVVRDVLIELLTLRYPQRLPWVRVSRAGPGAGWKGRLIGGLGAAALSARCRAAGVASSAHLLGIYDFTGDAASHRSRLSNWWSSAVDGDVLMCHPASWAEAGDPIGAARQVEYEAMTGAWWRQCLDAHQIQLSRGAGCVSN